MVCALLVVEPVLLPLPPVAAAGEMLTPVYCPLPLQACLRHTAAVAAATASTVVPLVLPPLLDAVLPASIVDTAAAAAVAAVTAAEKAVASSTHAVCTAANPVTFSSAPAGMSARALARLCTPR